MTRIGKRISEIRDALIIAFLTTIVVIVANSVDAFEVIAGWSRQHEEWHAGVLLIAKLSLAVAVVVLAGHRSAELPGRLDERRRAEEARRARE